MQPVGESIGLADAFKTEATVSTANLDFRDEKNPEQSKLYSVLSIDIGAGNVSMSHFVMENFIQGEGANLVAGSRDDTIASGEFPDQAGDQVPYHWRAKLSSGRTKDKQLEESLKTEIDSLAATLVGFDRSSIYGPPAQTKWLESAQKRIARLIEGHSEIETIVVDFGTHALAVRVTAPEVPPAAGT
jgi:hypothetical protein